ncbi:MAG: hypothetical protein ACI86M_003633 [Saprospiraceae bacterium]|jgi:hypothetical protein
MKIKNRKLTLFIIILTINSSALSQGYLSKFVHLPFLPNPTHLLYDNGEYKVSSIGIIEGREASIFITLDENFDTISTKTYFDVFFGRFGPRLYNDRYYAYGADKTTVNETHLLVTMDSDFTELRRDTFYSDKDSYNANSMTMIGDKIVGAAWDYYDCEESFECTSMNYKVITTDGEELQSINIDDEDYFFSFEVDHTEEENIIFGGNSYGSDGAVATVYRMDLEGNVQWKHKSIQKQSRGNVPVFVEELSEGTIVYTDKLNKNNDPDYNQTLFASKPAQLVWLSPDGDPIYTFLDSLSALSFSEFKGIKGGKGDYFFAYGFEHINTDNNIESARTYGFIMKFANDGEIMWRRRYKHSNYSNAAPTIRHLIEHDNGDLSALGDEVNSEGSFMWMLRVNEHGCLGEDDCDMPMVLPTEDLQEDEGDAIKIYPNPAANFINIVSANDLKISHVAFFDMQGRLNSNVIEMVGNQVGITELEQGLYFMRIELDSGDSVFKKVLIKR